jgi:hypothetical protein
MWMLDYFPIVSDCFPDTALPVVITGVRALYDVMKHEELPCQPTYDLKGIPKSWVHTVQVPSDSIYIATHGNYAIPADSSLHPDNLYLPLKRTVTLVQTLAHQFNLVGEDSLEDEQVVLIRRGVEVITLGETWRLTNVVYERDSTHLYYRPEWCSSPLPVTMVISQPNPRELNLRGDYRVVEAW